MLWFTTCREAGLLRLPLLSTNFALNIPWWAFWTVTLVTCCNSTCVTHTQIMTSMSTQSCWARAMGKAAALQPVQQWVSLYIYLTHTQMNNSINSWHDYLIYLMLFMRVWQYIGLRKWDNILFTRTRQHKLLTLLLRKFQLQNVWLEKWPCNCLREQMSNLH